jgi:transposase-like protein
MNTLDPGIQLPAPSRRHARYSDEFKRQVVAACQEPGVSKAAIALANGLNANMLRRWVVESSQRNDYQLAKLPAPLVPDRANCGFIPVKLASPAPVTQADIRIELQHARGAIQIHWPISASSQCAQWLREVLA